jgi:uncharacterized protein (DUF1697 family)
VARYVAFLRAINVGTANRIKMVDLAALVESTGCTNVSWYLQTGNLFFDSPPRSNRDALAAKLEATLAGHGFKNIAVMLRTPQQLATLVALDPFAALDNAITHFSTTFLRIAPAATPTDRLTKHNAEVVYLDETVVCVAVPKSAELSGGVSTVIDKPWGTPTTTRWWHVVAEITERANAG